MDSWLPSIPMLLAAWLTGINGNALLAFQQMQELMVGFELFDNPVAG